jgi:type II secretory pathway component GspD/PulD (secretin)
MRKSLFLCVLVCGLLFFGVLLAGGIGAQESPGTRDPFGNFSLEEPAAPASAAENLNPQSFPDIKQLSVQTVMLKFLRAENLKEAIIGMHSPFGKVSIDPGTNSVILCDFPEYLDRIVSEIRRADRMPQQILIEVVIADVQLVDDTEIGVNWDFLLGGAENRGTTSEQIMLDTFDTIPAAAAGMDLTFLNSDLTVTLHALQEQRNVELLATPRIVVLSGQEAEIKTVEEIPYTETSDTSAGGSLTSTQFKEVGVTLTVKAVVTDERKIQLLIQPRQNVTTGVSATDVPIVNTREARTTLLVDDGQVIVLGGLRRKETIVTTKKVPLLGDLPLLGILFSSEKKENTNSELIIMMSPHLDTGYGPTAEQMKRFDSMRNQPMLQIPSSKTNLESAYGPIDRVLELVGPPKPVESGKAG